jgi:hypothetical protein
LVRFDSDALLDLVVVDDPTSKAYIYWNVTPGAPTGVEWQAPLQATNPLHVPRLEPDGSVRITYTLARTEAVHLAVFDVRGRRLWSRAQCPSTDGTHSVLWDRRDAGGQWVARGVYWVQLESPQAAYNRKVLLLGR